MWDVFGAGWREGCVKISIFSGMPGFLILFNLLIIVFLAGGGGGQLEEGSILASF